MLSVDKILKELVKAELILKDKCLIPLKPLLIEVTKNYNLRIDEHDKIKADNKIFLEEMIRQVKISKKGTV